MLYVTGRVQHRTRHTIKAIRAPGSAVIEIGLTEPAHTRARVTDKDRTRIPVVFGFRVLEYGVVLKVVRDVPHHAGTKRGVIHVGKLVGTNVGHVVEVAVALLSINAQPHAESVGDGNVE